MRVLALIAAVGCGGKPNAVPDPLATMDLAQASTEIRAMVDGCPGLARALDRLSASGIAGRGQIGLVDDALDAARGRCERPELAGEGTAHRLAKARMLDAKPSEALAALGDATAPAIRWRRAELLDRGKRHREALAELDGSGLADDGALALRRRLAISIAVADGKHADVAREIAAAPAPERPALAYRAAVDTAYDALTALGTAAVEPELAAVAGDRLEQERGPASALAVREHAAKLAPDRAEPHDALARALAAANRIDDAIAAWDRAAALAPAQASYRLAVFRLLVAADRLEDARSRVTALAAAARGDVDALLVASSAAATVKDGTRAVALAREAQKLRPTDGRLAFTVAGRLVEAGEQRAAADALVELLVCGAHGRAWHRHEVAGQLAALPRPLVIAALDRFEARAKRPCIPVAPDDLATYTSALRKPS